MTRRNQSANIQISTRMKESLRSRLERAAERRGVSMNREINVRLECSFADEDAVIASFHGERIFNTARMFASAIQLLEARTGKHWDDDPTSALKVNVAFQTIFGVEGVTPKMLYDAFLDSDQALESALDQEDNR
jgi:hypothetical protein